MKFICPKFLLQITTLTYLVLKDQLRFIAIDNQGLGYVSDTSNHRVQEFTSEGDYINYLSLVHKLCAGSGPGQLQSPTGIVIECML